MGGGRISRSTAELGALAEAREQGRQEALAEAAAAMQAHRRAAEAAEHAARSLAAALDQVEHVDLGTLDDLQQQALALAVGIAEELVGRELRTFDDVAADTVRRALNLTPDRGDVVLRVNPSDLPAVLDSAAVMGHRAGDVQVVADATIGRGGCVAVVGHLRVDAQLDAALARIKESFRS